MMALNNWRRLGTTCALAIAATACAADEDPEGAAGTGGWLSSDAGAWSEAGRVGAGAPPSGGTPPVSGGSGGTAPSAGGGSAGRTVAGASAGMRASSGAGGRAGAPGNTGRGGSGGAYVVDRPANEPGILIHVENGCPFDLWIRGAGNGGVLQPDGVKLAPGKSQDYIAPDQWSAARVTAYGAGPNAQGQLQQELDKVEMTLGNKVINYNITYVDWLGLPVEMLAFGKGSDCKIVGCYVPVSEVAARCPSDLLEGKKCLSAGNYCARSANKDEPFCQALDEKIVECASDPERYPGCEGAMGAKTPEVYGCSGFFGQSPKWCAALNRGMLEAPEDGDITKYYQATPYNTYSKWVHQVCPGIYAFPYDDYGKTNESGFHACSGGTQLNITFCPAG